MVGVSGVRGIVDKDLTPDIVARWARAFGRWAGERKPLVVVGRDSRPSGPRFARAVHEGLTAAGCDVIDVGLVPTPTIQLAVTFHHAGGGIAVTASHNPSEWNALKFIGGDGIFLDGAEGVRVRDWAASGSEDGVRRTGDAPGVRGADAGAIERYLKACPRCRRWTSRRFACYFASPPTRCVGGWRDHAGLARALGVRRVVELTPDGLFRALRTGAGASRRPHGSAEVVRRARDVRTRTRTGWRW
jgi:hypothetical protein